MNKSKNELKTCDDVQGLTSEIIHTLQDDYGYLKPQEFTTAGNLQGDGIYNWSAHEVIEELIMKRFIIKKLDKKYVRTPTEEMINDNTIGIGELDE